MTTSRYRGFRVLARPYQLRECKRWTVDIEIRRNGRCQAFSTNGRYHTEHEAGAHCFSLARRIIDGAERRWSVDFLRSPRRNRRRLSRTWMAVSVRQLLVAGIVLLVAGGLLLLRGGGSTSSGHVPDAGLAEVSTREGPGLPPPVSGATVAAGVVLVVIGVRNRT